MTEPELHAQLLATAAAIREFDRCAARHAALFRWATRLYSATWAFLGMASANALFNGGRWSRISATALIMAGILLAAQLLIGRRCRYWHNRAMAAVPDDIRARRP